MPGSRLHEPIPTHRTAGKDDSKKTHPAHHAGAFMSRPSLRADVMRPSALGANEIAVWRQMQAETPSLHRAFFSPGFALACEHAIGRVYVAVLHDKTGIRG